LLSGSSAKPRNRLGTDMPWSRQPPDCRGEFI
jgi:hypothetical protein